jgi:imidazolonepropionase-like amidohydrolase
MRNASRLLSLLLVLVAASSAQLSPQTAAGQAAEAPAAKLIKAGRVLDVRSGKYLLDLGILTEGEKIKQIGPWAEVEGHAPKDATLLDLSRATLLPGLIDCHAHLLIAAELGRLDAWDLVINTITRTSPSLRSLMGARNAREVLDAGFTSARVLGHSGIDGDVALRDAINAGWIPGPRLQAAARKITTVGAVYVQSAVSEQVLRQEFLTVSGQEEAKAAVRENMANGADLIKIVVDSEPARGWKTRYMPLEDAKAIVEEAHRFGVRVAAHAQDNVAVQIAIDAGVDSIEHAWTATEDQLKQMKERGIFLVATDVFFTAPPRERLQRAMKLGVKIAMGSDAWALLPGKTRGEETLLELKKLSDEGMPAIEVIRSSTLNAAELMGWSDRVGELAPGRYADIIAVEGDPLQDIGLLQHVQFVMKGGTVVRDREIAK